MILIKFVFSWPLILIAAILETIAPATLHRRCGVCKGEGYTLLETKGLLQSCPTCGWGAEDCPTCNGHGVIKVSGEIYVHCTECLAGEWPRFWAWHLNLVTDLEGYWKSETLNYLYRDSTRAARDVESEFA